MRRLTDARVLGQRYHTDSGVDGLEGQEGTFRLCTFWLAHALALAGRGTEDNAAWALDQASPTDTTPEV